jgi:plastocyanin
MTRTHRDTRRGLRPLASVQSRAAPIALAVALVLGVSATSPAATDPNVSIIDRSYQPSPITINVGETVTWTNQSLMSHTVTDVAGGFGSPVISPGESFSVTFSTPGEYLYMCTIHPGMKGTVIVRAGPAPGAPEAGGASGGPQSVQVHLSTHRGPHGSQTLVRVQAPRPGATAVLELYRGSVWRRVAQTRLNAQGRATLSAGSATRRLRVAVLGRPGEPALISRVLRPPA